MQKAERAGYPARFISSANCKTEPAKGARPDRKDAKAAIHGMLGPRRPGAGRFPLLTVFPARQAYAWLSELPGVCWGSRV